MGEAAGFISPSSLEGISYAFDSALALADAFNKEDANDARAVLRRYRQTTAGLRQKVLHKGWKARILYTPVLRKLIMRSGISALDLVPSSR